MIQTVFIFNVGNGIECETKQGVFNKEKERNEAEIERTKVWRGNIFLRFIESVWKLRRGEERPGIARGAFLTVREYLFWSYAYVFRLAI